MPCCRKGRAPSTSPSFSRSSERSSMVSRAGRDPPEGDELERPPAPCIPPGPHPDPMCLQSLLPNPNLLPDLSTLGLPSWPLSLRDTLTGDPFPPLPGCGGLPAPGLLLGEPGGWAMGAHPAPRPPRNRPRGSHPERLPDVRPQWQGRGEQGRVSGSWPGCGEAWRGTALIWSPPCSLDHGPSSLTRAATPRLPLLLTPQVQAAAPDPGRQVLSGRGEDAGSFVGITPGALGSLRGAWLLALEPSSPEEMPSLWRP